jgi:hypothetical protein
VRITPCRVHDEHTGVLPHGFCECFGALFDDDVAPAVLAGDRAVEGWAVLWVFAVLEGRDDDVIFETRLSLSKHALRALSVIEVTSEHTC